MVNKILLSFLEVEKRTKQSCKPLISTSKNVVETYKVLNSLHLTC